MTLKRTTSRPKRSLFRPNTTNYTTRLLFPLNLLSTLRLNHGIRVFLRHRLQMGKQLLQRVASTLLYHVNLLQRQIPHRHSLPTNDKRVPNRSIRSNKLTHAIQPRRTTSTTIYRYGKGVLCHRAIPMFFNGVEGFSRGWHSSREPHEAQ